MARPPKNNADYFPHDSHMRNDSRILAVRRKYGLTGYAIYGMMIESLTNSNHFRIKIDEVNIEILAGDFGIEQDKLLEIIKYCVQIDLFQMDEDLLCCNTLDNRLQSLINRRVSDDNNHTETPQKPYSKVKESKVKESKIEESKGNSFDEKFLIAFDEITCERYKMTFKGLDLAHELQQFRIKCDNDPINYYHRDSAGLRTAFQYQLKNSKPKNGKQRPADKLAEVARIIASEKNTL